MGTEKLGLGEGIFKSSFSPFLHSENLLVSVFLIFVNLHHSSNYPENVSRDTTLLFSCKESYGQNELTRSKILTYGDWQN